MALQEGEDLPTRKGSTGRGCQSWERKFLIYKFYFSRTKYLAEDFYDLCVMQL